MAACCGLRAYLGRNITTDIGKRMNDERMKRLAEIPIADLHLSDRARKILEQLGVLWVADLAKVDSQDLLIEGPKGNRYLIEVQEELGRVCSEVAREMREREA